MYFDTQKFLKGAGYYTRTLPVVMLLTNWSAICGNSISATATEDFNETIYLPRAARAWLQWRPKSAGTWLVKWFIVPGLLLALAAYTLLGIAFKLGGWSLGLVPFFIGLFLVSIRLEQTRLTSA